MRATRPAGGTRAEDLRHLRDVVTRVMAPESAVVKVTAVIEADDRNRHLEIAAISDSHFRSSQIQLEGREARRVFTFEYCGIPHGQYQVVGTLTGTDGRPVAVTRVFAVLARNGR